LLLSLFFPFKSPMVLIVNIETHKLCSIVTVQYGVDFDRFECMFGQIFFKVFFFQC